MKPNTTKSPDMSGQDEMIAQGFKTIDPFYDLLRKNENSLREISNPNGTMDGSDISELIQFSISFYEQQEHYEKCAFLNVMLSRVNKMKMLYYERRPDLKPQVQEVEDDGQMTEDMKYWFDAEEYERYLFESFEKYGLDNFEMDGTISGFDGALMIENIIGYFGNLKEYDKCAFLQKLLAELYKRNALYKQRTK